MTKNFGNFMKSDNFGTSEHPKISRGLALTRYGQHTWLVETGFAEPRAVVSSNIVLGPGFVCKELLVNYLFVLG